MLRFNRDAYRCHFPKSALSYFITCSTFQMVSRLMVVVVVLFAVISAVLPGTIQQNKWCQCEAKFNADEDIWICDYKLKVVPQDENLHICCHCEMDIHPSVRRILHLTLFNIQTLTAASAVDDLWKHCGKNRNSSPCPILSLCHIFHFKEFLYFKLIVFKVGCCRFIVCG